MFIELSSRQNTQYLNAQAVYHALQQARRDAKPYAGSLFWREINGENYLIRWLPPDSQKSLGVKNESNAGAVDKFRKGKEKAIDRLRSLETEFVLNKKLNKALRVGRVPEIVANMLNAIREAELDDHFLVIGTHALFAYEAAAGVLFPHDSLATEDVDILYDTRKRVKFVTKMQRLDSSFLEVLQKVDKTFQLMEDQRYTAVNDKGFQVDVVRRMARDLDPHPLRLTEKEDDFWAVQISSGGRLLSARPFSQMVVSSNGTMAMMHTIHPLDFAQVKAVIGQRIDRDPLKARKDLLQSDLVRNLVDEYLPHLAVRADANV